MFYNLKNYTRAHKIIVFAIFSFVGGIFYYSWLPDSGLKTETYLPKWLLKWSNHYFNLRTAIPFVPFGFLLEVLTNTSKKKSLNNQSCIAPFRVQNICIATLVICIAEGGQFFVSNRNPDILDVIFGVLGSILGGIIYYLTKKK